MRLRNNKKSQEKMLILIQDVDSEITKLRSELSEITYATSNALTLLANADSAMTKCKICSDLGMLYANEALCHEKIKMLFIKKEQLIDATLV